MFDMKLDWRPDMATGIDMIDNQHKQILRIGRDIEQLLQRNCINATQQELLKIVCEIRDFSGYHFYAEESLMEECSYSDIKNHKKLHQEIVKKITSFDLTLLKKDPEGTLKIVRDEIQDEVFNHMLVEDQRFAKEYLAYMRSRKAQDKLLSDDDDDGESRYGIKLCDLDMTHVYLHPDQSCTGRVVLVSKERRSSLSKFATLERNIFFADVFAASSAIMHAFKPDTVEYGYFGDIDDCVVFHVVPKYKTDKDTWGIPFDPRITSSGKGPGPDECKKIAEKLKKELLN